MKCKYCDKETTNPVFCSKSCAAIWNNKFYIKRKKKINYCKSCGLNETLPQRSYCSLDCNPRIINKNLTINDVKNRYKTIWEFHAILRGHSRRIYFKQSKNTFCEKCGYSKHIEICHIKSVSEFSDDILISEVNDIKNLIGLCRNCHWEMDNL